MKARASNTDGAWPGLLPLIFSVLAIVSWVALSAAFNPAQFGDNIEQLNWAHGIEWGYWKHPPLPTVLLALPLRYLAPSPYWTYVLAALCFAGTAFFTWKIASRLLGRRGADLTVVLLTLHLGFSWRAQIYNHNTVLLLLVAMTAAATLAALDRPALWRWLLAGVAAGLALLSKYQALVPLAGILGALFLSGTLKLPRQRLGAACALAIASLIFAPHLLWLIANHFPTLRYASHADQHLGLSARLTSFAGFFVAQIRFHFPQLAALGLATIFLQPQSAAAYAPLADDKLLRAWLWGLIGIPAVLLCLMVLAGGVNLEGHWGLQTFQFVSILIAAKLLASAPRLTLRNLMLAAFAIHVIGMAMYIHAGATPQARAALKSRDRIYPAEQLAGSVLRDWKKTGACPLAYVVGPPFESGLIAAYSGDFAAVLEDGDLTKSPWIDAADLARRGAIQVAVGDEEAARLAHLALPGIGALQSMQVPGRGKDPELERTVFWRIVPPTQNCATR